MSRSRPIKARGAVRTRAEAHPLPFLSTDRPLTVTAVAHQLDDLTSPNGHMWEAVTFDFEAAGFNARLAFTSFDRARACVAALGKALEDAIAQEHQRVRERLAAAAAPVIDAAVTK